MISVVFNQDSFKLLTVFSLSPGSRFGRKELQQLTLLNNVPLDKALLRLVYSGMIIKNKKYFSVNIENKYAEAIVDMCSKQHTVLKKIPLKVYFMLADFVFQASVFKGVEIYLFGSYSKLVFGEKSDVDIAVLVSPEKAKIKETLSAMAGKLSKNYGKELQPHFFDRKGFYSNRRDALVREIIKNGIRLIYGN